MSKVDAQRAMKAARHARTEVAPPPPARPAARVGTTRSAAPSGSAKSATTTAVAPAAATTPAVPGTPAPVTTTPVTTTPGTTPQVPTAQVTTALAGASPCGHRNMAGKECRRPAGHPEKSHRYS